MATFARNRSSRTRRDEQTVLEIDLPVGGGHPGGRRLADARHRASPCPGGHERPCAKAKPWTMPRTPDGRPDLQGTWSNGTITPLERPDGASLVLSKDEVARLEKGMADRVKRLDEPSDPNRPAPPKGGDGSTGAAGNVGGYNNFWLEPGDRVAIVNGEWRSSLIVDPPNGKIPALTPEARQRNAARLAAMKGRGQYDHPEFRPLGERCIMSFGSNAGPPMLPNYFYNNNYQIVQTTGSHHDPRRDGARRPHRSGWAASASRNISVPGWATRLDAGKATRWSSRRRTSTRCRFSASASENLKVIERFTRDRRRIRFSTSSRSTIRRRLPSRGAAKCPSTAPTSSSTSTRAMKANYALSNILSGERAREREQTKKKQP